MNQRSRLWRPSSAFLLVLLLCLASAGQAAARGSLLLFPLRSHWLSRPMADATTSAVSDRLSQAGYAVTQVAANSPVVQLAVTEGWIPVQALQQNELSGLAEPLGIATGADAAIFGEVAEREAEVVLSVTLAGIISGQQTKLEFSVERGADLKACAARLAEELAVALTPMTWGEIGADAAGKRVAAVARYAAGQAAMGAGMYRDAVMDFDAALLGDPASPIYLRADAEARQALGDYSGAVVRMRSLAAVAPNSAEVSLQLGEAALRAGKPAEAEAAFLRAAEGLGQDPRVVEGLALACKAQGKRDRAQEYYQLLVSLLPALAESPPTLPALLADSDVTVRLAGGPQDEIGREMARLYFAGGRFPQGVAWLLIYHRSAGRPPYTDADYLDIAAWLDKEADEVARGAQGILAAQSLGQSDDEQAAIGMDALHGRSDTLATLAERMQVSAVLDPAHRYRVLAYNLLNQSNFEALMYLRTRDEDRQKRSELLRDAYVKSREEAESLAAGLLGSVAGAPSEISSDRSPGGPPASE